MKEIAIALDHVSFAYQESMILTDVSLSIPQGEFYAVIGPNGGGKTTLIKLMLGLLTPCQGSVTLLGQKPHLVRSSIGYVSQHQTIDQYFPITVDDLVLTGSARFSTIFGRYPKKIKEKSYQLMEELSLTKEMGKPFHTLSGGNKQKAYLARSLLSDPSILFLDESLANIDIETRKEILSFLFSLKGKMTILMVTHDLHVAFEKVQKFLCVERDVTTMEPKDVCEHFALGLYHTPLHEHE